LFVGCGKRTQSDAYPDSNNKQTLADTFRDLVRYAMLKIHRDVVKFGVTPDKFTVEVMDKSLAAPANVKLNERLQKIVRAKVEVLKKATR